jgi:hypothetical protein
LILSAPRLALAAVFSAVLGGCGHDGADKSDWERRNEGLVGKDATDPLPPFPAFPKRSTLLEFEPRAPGDFRYYIDGATLNVDAKKNVISYVLVARSLAGAENVAFEAINCKSDEYRVYALGRADGTWGGRPGGWRPIVESRQPQYRSLQRDYFCPQNTPIGDADEGRRALQAGGHPWSRGFDADSARRPR